MKRKQILALQVLWLLLFALPIRAQSNYSFQYWFNNDTAAVSKMNISATNNAFTDIVVPASNSLLGVNKINYRVVDSQNKSSAIGYFYYLKGVFLPKLTELEYWLNNDYTASKKMSISAVNNSFAEYSIPASSAPFGINKINYRVSDGQNNYSSVGYSYFLRGFFGANQPALEYWFNNDFAAVTKFNYTAKKDSFTVLDIPAKNTPFGVNKINFRFSDGPDKRSSIAYFYFMKGFLGAKQTVVEYWFDDKDSQKSQIAVADSTVKLEFNAPITDLSIGIHTMHIRAGYTTGVYTAPQTSYFFKLSQGAQKGNLEYWFDNDVAHKVQHKLANWENMVELNLDVSALATGTHKLNVRAGVESGLLSPVSSSYFFKGVNKYQIPVTSSKVVNYRYWFDNDKLAMHTGTISDITQQITFLKDIPANSLDKGKHDISIQFQNSQGQWSDVAYGEFEKRGNRVLSIPQLLADKGLYKTGDNILLSGFNFEKYGKLRIDYYYNGFAKSAELYADKNGKVSFTIPSVATGNYTFSATNLTTNLKSPDTFAKVKLTSASQNYLKLNYPTGSNFKINLKDSILVKWSDFIKFDYRYSINNILSKRSYNYLIELYGQDGNKLEEKSEIGESNLETEQNFTAIYTPQVVGKYYVKVTDVVSGNNLSTVWIDVVDNAYQTVINTEWDYSTIDLNGKYMRDGHPLGVGADGTGRIYLTVETKGAKTIKEVSVSLSDAFGKLTGTGILGRVIPATVVNANSDEANKATFDNATSNNVIGNKVWFWYVAPDDFTKGDDIYKSESSRNVTARFEVAYSDYTTETLYKTIEVVRPAILLVHGLNSSLSCWNDFRLDNTTLIYNDTRFKTVKAINAYPDASFEKNAFGLLGFGSKEQNSTFEYPIRDLRSKGYASNRVDYICHSMGGCMLRYAAENIPAFYSKSKTYGYGFTNKVITIDTPHEGSPLGDLVGYIAKNPLLGLIVSKGTNDNLAKFDFNSLSYQWSEAVRNLSLLGGSRFNKETKVKAHLIGADMFKDIQNTAILNLDQLKQLAKVVPVNSFLSDVLMNSILLSTATKLALIKRNFEIFAIKDENERKIAKWDEVIKRTLFPLTVTTSENIVVDGDGIVSRYSQFAGDLSSVDNKTIIENEYAVSTFSADNGLFHTQIVNNNQVETKVSTLLNSSINSSLFGSIPAHIGSPTKVKSEVKTDSVSTGVKLTVNIDTTKVKILSPTSSFIVKTGETIDVKAGVMDTVGLQYVELQFQGKVYQDFSKENNLFFQIPVMGEYLNTQKLVLQAFYYFKDVDSVSIVSDSKLIEVSPAYSPLNFAATDKVIFMNQGDTVQTSYEVVFPTSLYRFRKDPNLKVNVNNLSVLQYDVVNASFIAKLKGNTFAEVEYAGLKDTIYFVLEGNEDIVTTIPNSWVATNGKVQALQISPNPAKSIVRITSKDDVQRIEICDLSGRVVRTETIDSRISTIDVQSLQNGVYIIKAYMGDRVEVQRLIKE